MATLEYVVYDVEYFQLFLLPHSAEIFQDDSIGNARQENNTLFLNHTGYLLLSTVSLVWFISQSASVQIVTSRWLFGCVSLSELAIEAREYRPYSSASYSPLYILFLKCHPFELIFVPAAKIIILFILHKSFTLFLFSRLS